MKRTLTLLSAALLVAGVSSAFAHEHGASAKAGMAMGKTAPGRRTIAGEVVDTGCYLGHGARGEKHVSCATKCINNGMPMGLLTDDGTLYLLTMNHDDGDPYNKLKSEAGKKVRVTGTVMNRSGMKAIEVDEYSPVAVNASR